MTNEDIDAVEFTPIPMPEPDGQPEATEARTPIISLRNVRKTYNAGTPKEVTVLKGISLDIYPGEVVVLVGPSGCGKSTLLRSMNLIAPPTAER